MIFAQHGSRRNIVVPQPVMDGLKVPHLVSIPRLEAHDRFGKEIVAEPRAAVLSIERSSLPALGWLWKNRRRIMARRRAIQSRRKVSDRELARWFR